jgi:nitroreductase / dihydropteridine reductase
LLNEPIQGENMDFEKIVASRYAVKKFDGKKLPQDKVDRLLEIIRNSASSYGLQPWKIMVISDAGTKKKLAPASWNQPQIESCSHLLVFCAYTDVKKLIEMLEKAMMDAGASHEGIKGYISMMKGFEEGLSQEKKLCWSQRQTYLALGNAINGAKSLGFDSCPMEGFSPEEYSKILHLPKDVVPTALCPIGYAADTPRSKVRFRKEEVFF